MTVRQFAGGLNHEETGRPWGRFVPEYVLVRADSPSTRIDYLYMLSRHILPILGDLPIGDVTHDQLSRLIAIKSDNSG